MIDHETTTPRKSTEPTDEPRPGCDWCVEPAIEKTGIKKGVAGLYWYACRNHLKVARSIATKNPGSGIRNQTDQAQLFDPREKRQTPYEDAG